jgi:hypothetical protein
MMKACHIKCNWTDISLDGLLKKNGRRTYRVLRLSTEGSLFLLLVLNIAQRARVARAAGAAPAGLVAAKPPGGATGDILELI